MKTNIKWLPGVLVALALLFVLPSVMRFFLPVFGVGMMRGGGMFSWAGMGLSWLFPLGLAAVLGLGVAWLAGSFRSSKPDPELACPACGEALEPGLKVCPHCATEL